MKIAEMALRRSRLTYLAVIILVAGIATFLDSSQEEPSVTIRDAVVAVLKPTCPPNVLSS
ncbi:hypothetical protein [Enterobacter cloacae complex sp. 288G10]|uniref:hypothetical protein n=1 Tax=Enterobacter cloacae complex sp. 288G10 TaxID=3395859 RepID=UPI003CF865FC